MASQTIMTHSVFNSLDRSSLNLSFYCKIRSEGKRQNCAFWPGVHPCMELSMFRQQQCSIPCIDEQPIRRLIVLLFSVTSQLGPPSFAYDFDKVTALNGHLSRLFDRTRLSVIKIWLTRLELNSNSLGTRLPRMTSQLLMF